jgi:hypothetical protein
MKRALAYSALLVLLAACSLGEPSQEAAFANVQWRIGSGASACLSELAQAAKNTLKFAFYDISDPGLIELLKNKAAEGLVVEVILSSVGTASVVSDLNTAASSPDKPIAKTRPAASENVVVNMRQNYAIIDDRTAVFFTDSRLSEPCTLALVIRQEDLLQALIKEFSQMFDGNNYGSAKVKYLNYMEVFPSTAGDIDMYFLPSNGGNGEEVFGNISTRMQQTRQAIDTYARQYSNTRLNGVFQEIKNSGEQTGRIAAEFYGGNFVTPPAFVNHAIPADLSCNAIFIDTASSAATMIFVTCPFAALSASINGETYETDGVVLFVRGDIVRQIKAALDAAISQF